MSGFTPEKQKEFHLANSEQNPKSSERAHLLNASFMKNLRRNEICFNRRNNSAFMISKHTWSTWRSMKPDSDELAMLFSKVPILAREQTSQPAA